MQDHWPSLHLFCHLLFSTISPFSRFIVFDKSPPPSSHYSPSSPTLFVSSTDLRTSFLLPSFVSFLSLSSSLFSQYPSPSLPLPGVVSVARALLFLTATALTSMTFFSCLVRHQTPALGEATLLHRRRAAAKLCTGTARQWSRTVSRRRWGGGDGGGGRIKRGGG